MSCVVCRRDSRGFGFRDPVLNPFAPNPYKQACSMWCLDIITHYWKVGEVLNPTQYEKAALAVASDAAGGYLESLGKTDLTTLTQEEWTGLLEIVFSTSTAEIQRLSDENAVPF